MSFSRFPIMLLLTLLPGLLFSDVAAAQKGREKGSKKHGGVNHGQGGQRSDPKRHASELAREKASRPNVDPNGWARKAYVPQPQFEGPVADKQVLVEQRKLEHRTLIADHLRQVSERNGNENLLEVADRLELKAQQHYEKRMAKINVGGGSEEPALVGPEPEEQMPLNPAPTEDPSALGEPVARSVLEPLSASHGQTTAIDQRLLNAERTLDHRLGVADHLRQVGEAQGDSRLIEASEQLNDMALNQYTRQLTEITGFQERLEPPSGE